MDLLSINDETHRVKNKDKRYMNKEKKRWWLMMMMQSELRRLIDRGQKHQMKADIKDVLLQLSQIVFEFFMFAPGPTDI